VRLLGPHEVTGQIVNDQLQMMTRPVEAAAERRALARLYSGLDG
jgi:hypothetical protein